VTGASAPGLEAAAWAKQAVRERVWALLERERVARFPGARGRIPNFAGAPVAAARPAALPAWRAADVVKANPDADGGRVGKGGGLSDLEFALLVEAGLIGDDTVVATTVHPLQALEEALPETDYLNYAICAAILVAVGLFALKRVRRRRAS
jgi:5-formyltetrahydrofolate cyclo-ligase